MRKLAALIIFLIPFFCTAQENYQWWNEIHGWKPGMPGWRTMLTISPGFLGPNALPVPEMKKGIIPGKKEIELGTDFHFMEGDNTQNIAGRFYYPFIENRIAVEISGVMLEYYAMSTEIRDERVARDKDGMGLAVGDLYFTTYVQIFKDRKFPDTMLRASCKTASGGRLDAARYADSPGYFFDVSFSKRWNKDETKLNFIPFGSLGFYSWQTNAEYNVQNDAFMYGLGFDLEKGKWTLSNSWSGFHGYKDDGDRPMVYTIDLKRQIKNNSIRLQYLHGLHDWMYKTVKLSYIWRWN